MNRIKEMQDEITAERKAIYDELKLHGWRRNNQGNKKFADQDHRNKWTELDILFRMKQIEQRSYLYETENKVEYKPEYDEFKLLTEVLEQDYGRDIEELSAWYQEKLDHIDILAGQKAELNRHYKLLGNFVGKDISDLYKIAEVEKTNQQAAAGFVNSRIFYVKSTNPDIAIQVTVSPEMGLNGKVVGHTKITLVNRDGEVIDSRSTDDEGFKGWCYDIQRQYGLGSMEKVYDIQDAFGERKAGEDGIIPPGSGDGPGSPPRFERQRYSFTEAINLGQPKTQTKRDFSNADPEALEEYRLTRRQEYTIATADKGHKVIINVKNLDPDGHDGIQLTVKTIDGSNQTKEYLIPPLENKDNEGFTSISEIAKAHGFSGDMWDNIYAFDTEQEAIDYHNEEEAIRQEEDQKSTRQKPTR